MILISKTFERVTDESAANGDYEETGFVFQDEAFTFSQLVHELREYQFTSSWPCRGEARDWVTTEDDVDYQTGDYTSYSLHFSHKNNPRAERYWRKALQFAGFVK
jgi:hypothetical protein